MNRKKERKRGYNQARELAVILGKKLDIPVRDDLLVHTFSSRSQHDRSGEERRRAAREEYFPSETAELAGERILLCDDVLTTGSTMSVCAEILKNIGASHVTAAVCGTTIH